MRMTRGLDEGPVLLSARVPITEDATAGQLSDHLSQIGAELMAVAIWELDRGKPLPESEQEHERATYAHKIDKAEGRLSWNESAARLEARVRAFSPEPGTFIEYRNRKGGVLRLRILEAASFNMMHNKPIGTLFCIDGQWLVACKFGALRLDSVQREGKKPMPAQEFLRGSIDVKEGSVL